jgi:hypothetical protein
MNDAEIIKIMETKFSIEEVKFLKDTQTAETGNEFYPAGSRAHFFKNQTAVLVKQGQAVFIDDIGEQEATSKPLPPAPDFQNMTVKQLRVLAVERGIGGLSGMRKADLIAALED